jgi:predicted transcriptional regulator
MDGVTFLRLKDCATSTKLGMADQGFPFTMTELATKGYVKPVGAGYQVTQKGIDYIRKVDDEERLRKSVAKSGRPKR